MKQSLKTKYLEQFPEQHRQFVHNRFSQAYIFSEQSYEFGEDDQIDPAVGPITMRARVVAACEELLPHVSAELRAVLEQVIATVDDSTELLSAVKTEVDADWEEARQYQTLHPKVEKKPEPATESQLGWLKKLGCTEIPKTKREASKLIDKHKGKPNVRSRTQIFSRSRS